MTAMTARQPGKWLLWMLWLFLGLSVLQPSDDLFRFVYFAAILPLTLYLYWHNREHEQRLLLSLVPGVALLLFLFVTVTWSSHEDESTGRYFRWFLETAIFFAAVVRCGYEIRRENLAFGRYLHLIVLAAALGSLSIYIFQGHYPGRLEGTGLLGHSILGSSVLISCWALGTLDPKMYTNRWPWLLVGSGIAVVAFVYLSQSRGPILALCGFLLCFNGIAPAEKRTHALLGHRARGRVGGSLGGSDRDGAFRVDDWAW